MLLILKYEREFFVIGKDWVLIKQLLIHSENSI